jgi:hypothetical protein
VKDNCSSIRFLDLSINDIERSTQHQISQPTYSIFQHLTLERFRKLAIVSDVHGATSSLLFVISHTQCTVIQRALLNHSPSNNLSNNDLPVMLVCIVVNSKPQSSLADRSNTTIKLMRESMEKQNESVT